MMEVHQLTYFAEVAATGNFTRAAENCHVTQPTLSHQLRKLEQELGEPLFQRTRSGAILTPLGKSLLPRARLILGEMRSMHEEARGFANLETGSLRVGVLPTIAPYLLPALVNLLATRHPGLSLHLAEETTESMLKLLHRGDMDIALASFDQEEAASAGVNYEEILRDDLLLAMPKGHRLAGRGRLGMADVMSYPFVLLKEAHCLSGQSLSVCRRGGFSPKVALRSSQMETVVALVEAGMGLSFIPAMAVTCLAGRGICCRLLHPDKPSRSVGLVWATDRIPTRAQESFAALCREKASSFGPASCGEFKTKMF